MSNPILCPDGLTSFYHLETFNTFAYRYLTTTSENILELDLSKVSFIRPAGIITLIALARLWNRQRRGYILITRIQSKVCAYLERMDLFRMYGDLLKISSNIIPSEFYFRSYTSKSLLEILPIPSNELQNPVCVDQAVARAQLILEGRYGPNTNVNRLCSVFSEILTNVVHSEDDGYALIQSYEDNPDTGMRVEIAVGDAGIGIQASLLSNEQIATEAAHRQWKKGSDFISYSLVEGVSAKASWADTGRGMGLTLVHQKVGNWEQGMLRIRSGGSMVELSHNQDTPRVFDGLVDIPGTQIVISISAKAFTSN
jgi:signal transduction histidine kinase